ncbi:MAG TPA: hypothetical protein DD381_01475 [Lentisphaeria bacterium]|nr:MAG: hypothetical protein A2X47_10555 [Lentisphaerae bacterium GWF2_38_69]HBM15013.1 hypothetical protein [Lentisphaeria bacterium]
MSAFKNLLILILLFFLLVLPSCSFLDKYDPGFIERQQNFENIKNVKVGMTKKQVIAIMGSPILDEIYNKPDVWFYYTDWDWADCARTEEESTPVVFKNGVVIGIGRGFYRNYSHEAWQYSNVKAILYDTTGQEE